MKYPESTKTFVYDTTNTHGGIRSCDCVVRSISLALGKSWLEVFDALVEIARKKGRMPNEDVVFYQYLEEQGWKLNKQPRKEDRTKYTGEEFVRKIANKRVCILSMANHLSCCLSDGKIHDIWDCSYKTVGRYWTKKV